MNRRTFLTKSAAGLLIPAAPAIISAANIMRVSPVHIRRDGWILAPSESNFIFAGSIHDEWPSGHFNIHFADRAVPAAEYIVRQ